MAENSGGVNVGDLVGAGKGINALFDLVKSTFGRITQSYFIREDADAQAYAMKVMANAEAERIKVLSAAVVESAPGTGGITFGQNGPVISSLPASEQDRLPNLPNLTLAERTESRTNYQEAIRTKNIESITANAAEDLKGNSPISDKKVDQDWANRFFRYAEDVSNEQMQMIWGKILSGEIKNPGSFSLRTMDVLRSLTQAEAESFNKISDRICLLEHIGYVIFDLNGYKIDAMEHVKLSEAGLIASSSERLKSTLTDGTVAFITSFGQVISGRILPGNKDLVLNYYPVSLAGVQIADLAGQKANMEYLTHIVNLFRANGSWAGGGEIAGPPNSDGGQPFIPYPDWHR